MLKEFLESNKTAKDFIEDTVISTAISDKTDEPNRREKPSDEIDIS